MRELFRELASCDLLVPVPLHPEELKIDEGSGGRFNQTEELARIVSEDLRIRVVKPLRKIRPQSMHGLGLEERKKAVQHLYELEPNVNLNGKSVILLDDVYTTGLTACTCAEILVNSGASSVSVLVLGRDRGSKVMPETM